MSTTQLEDIITKPNVESTADQPLVQQENQQIDCKSDHWQPDNIPNDCRQNQDDLDVSDERIKISVTERPKIEKCSVANRGHSNNPKLNFRPPQQAGLSKKLWNKPFKARLKYFQQSIKADMENLQNLKNQTVHRKQHPPKNIKQSYNKMISNRTTQFSVRSKFFLPDKRPRKEIIIPPTKFLLGGNISDPLNLNSLQDEAMNPTPNQTPRQSPITTPPKVEVIIPPNIYDPLHLLDPVDSVEYEKQLVSPMKRKSKSKHRKRKKKPTRKRPNDLMSDAGTVSTSTVLMYTKPVTASTVAARSISGSQSTTASAAEAILQTTMSGFPGNTSGELSAIHTYAEEKDYDCKAGRDTSGLYNAAINGRGNCCRNTQKENNNESAPKSMMPNSNSLAARRSTDRERVTRDLRLDLNGIGGGEQQQMAIGGGRKRRISEGPNSMKNKFRRMDSMDKIVSPVVPQPGAWKRPPRTVPTGARKASRLRSTSVSETDLISPTDDTKTIECTSESIQGDNTPDIDAQKHLPGGEVAADISNEMQSKQPQQPQPKQQTIPKFKPDGARFQYGNYDRYSGYRNLNEIMDVRLKVFHRHAHLFRGKDIIDIGCNVGHITMAVAKDLMPNSIMGLDIDRKLIMRARKNLSLFVNIPKCTINSKKKSVDSSSSATAISSTAAKDASLVTASNADSGIKDITSDIAIDTPSTTTATAIETITVPTTSNHVCIEPSKATEDDNKTRNKIQSKRNLNAKRKPYQKSKIDKEKHEFFPISFPIAYGCIPDLSTYLRNKDDLSPSYKSDQDAHFPKNVFFRAANYVLKDESLINNETQQYDVILCLSVTKWIHLNFGDIGLKQSFKRMFNQLRPGGKLILEAQNWASYKKKRNLTETIYNNYRNIEFFPNKFHEYLLSNEVGFSHSYCLGVPRHMNKGFCRPIQLYAKGDYTPNHISWSDNYHPQTPYEAYRGKYAGMTRPPYPLWGGYDTPHGNSGTYSCRQTPIYPGLSTSQYYNPLETDSYLPSYDTEIQNRHYVFASPLYQTVWSPPASLRNASNQTPAFGSIRDIDTEDATNSGPILRHVYPPNDCSSSPQGGGDDSAFNSIREPNIEENSQQAQSAKQHVYANCDSSLSPKIDNSSSPPIANRSNSSSRNPEQIDSVDETETELLVNVDNDRN